MTVARVKTVALDYEVRLPLVS